MIEKDGLEAFIVGGYVRDKLLGKEPSDKDYVVVGETEESMIDRGFTPIRATSFPVFLDEQGNEWALARTEESTGESYNDFDTFTEDVSLLDDLKRRDLTINSMAVHLDDEVIEPNVIVPPETSVLSDLENKVLRHTSDAFGQDPVRSLRLARFAGRYPSFRIHPSTLEVAQEAAERLSEQPNERVGREFMKAFDECKSVRKFLETLDRVDALGKIDKNLERMKYNDAGGSGRYHKEGSVWQHTLMVVEEVQKIRGNDRGALMMALVHDIGKVEDRYKHTVVGRDIASELIRENLVLSSHMERVALKAVREHMRIHNIPLTEENSMNAGKVIDFVERNVNYERLIDLAKADARGRIPYQQANVDRIRDRIEKAKEAYNEVDAQYSVEKRGSSIDDYDGEAIGEMIKQDRVELLKDYQ